MVKKKVKKTTETSAKTTVKKPELEKTLIDNFVNLQRVLTNLAVKFDALSDQISKLLELFEISAKSFAEKYKPETGEKKKDKEFLTKLDALLEQNKTLARGLTLMGEKLRERVYGHQTEKKERPYIRPIG